MNVLDPQKFKHTTLKHYPESVIKYATDNSHAVISPKRVGITLLDEKKGYTGIYIRDENGGLWPARTVSHKPKKHHESVCAAWMSGSGINEDKRKKENK